MTPLAFIPGRLWENLAPVAGIAPDTRWSGVSRASARRLAAILESTELQVSGKSLNKDEFVTCGGVRRQMGLLALDIVLGITSSKTSREESCVAACLEGQPASEL